MDDQRQMQEGQEERDKLNYAIAQRLQYAMQDGYLLPTEFEHVLYEMGILSNWRKHEHGKVEQAV